MTEKLGIALHQNRYVSAVAGLERRIAVNVDDFDRKTRSHLRPQGSEHLLAERAVAAAVQDVAREPTALPRRRRNRANRAHLHP